MNRRHCVVTEWYVYGGDGGGDGGGLGASRKPYKDDGLVFFIFLK